MSVKCKGSEIDFLVNSLIYEIPNSMYFLRVLEKFASVLFFFFFVNPLVFFLLVLLRIEVLLHNIIAKGSGGGGIFCLFA